MGHESRALILTIDSGSDPRLAAYRDVGHPRQLERAGLFVVEGRLNVRRLLGLTRDGRYDIVSLLIAPGALQALSDVLPDSSPWPVYVCDRSIVRDVTGFNFHRGCLALARRPAASTALPPIASATRLLALEGVGNPDNIGGLFRVASAMDVGGLVLDRTCGDPLYRKAIRTSMGAALRVPFVRLPDWLEGLHALRASGYRVIALTPDPAAESIATERAASAQPLVLIVGSESSGLAQDTMAAADARLRIPIDPAADSLNVVVAAAIALHELRGS